MTARDADSFWGDTIRQYFFGNPAPLAAALREKGTPIEGDEIREFLADLVTGGTLPEDKGGRPEERYPFRERALVIAVFQEREKRDKKGKRVSNEDAIAAVAEARSLSTGQVRGVVEKFRDGGITFEKWRRWGRPKEWNGVIPR